MYEIKNAQGDVVYTTTAHSFMMGYYNTVKTETGYAEVWYKGECIFKTR